MKLRITVDVFSGRPNPVVELDGRQAAEAVERLRPARKLKKGEVRLPSWPILGYRGLIVEQIGRPTKRLPRAFRVAGGQLFGPGLSHEPADPRFEDFIRGSSGPLRRFVRGRDFIDRLQREVDRFRRRQEEVTPREIEPPRDEVVCPCGPPYEPDVWNVSPRQGRNNCYNYATNVRTDSFASPGFAAGLAYPDTAELTCAGIQARALADALIAAAAADNACPDDGHLVALVIAPLWDYHWYRKGRNGYWSHKPGGQPVTNLDNNGGAINDPRTAARGPYTDFCTFMVVMHGHIKIF
jgi:hypothetical protein